MSGHASETGKGESTVVLGARLKIPGAGHRCPPLRLDRSTGAMVEGLLEAHQFTQQGVVARVGIPPLLA